MQFLAAAPLLVAVFAAQAQPVPPTPPVHHDIRWDERGGAALRTHVGPGSRLEWCGPLKAGDAVDWEFDSADALDVDVERREGSAALHPMEKQAVQLWSGRVIAAADQDYCWTWTNHSLTPTALQARLQRTPRAG